MVSKLFNTTERTGMFFAGISGMMYGLLGYFGMTTLQLGISVYSMSFWRFFGSFIFLLSLFAANKKLKIAPIKQLFPAFINGAVFYCIPGVLFFVASKHIGTGQAMVIFFTYPAFVMILRWLFERHIISKHSLCSFAVMVTGLIFLVDLSEVSYDLTGIGLSLLASLAYACYVYFSKKVPLEPINSSLMVSLGCTITCFILTLIEGSLSLPKEPSFWLNISGIAIISTALPMLLLLKALNYISADKASFLSVLEPVFTVVVGVLLLGEMLRLNHFIGIAIILVGALSISLKKNNN